MLFMCEYLFSAQIRTVDHQYFRTDQNQTLDLPSKDGLDVNNIKHVRKNLGEKKSQFGPDPTQNQVYIGILIEYEFMH